MHVSLFDGRRGTAEERRGIGGAVFTRSGRRIGGVLDFPVPPLFRSCVPQLLGLKGFILFCPSVQLLPSSSGRVPSAARKQHQDVPQELCQ